MRYFKSAILLSVAILTLPAWAGAEIGNEPKTSLLALDEHLPQLVRKVERSVVRVVSTLLSGDSFYGGGAIISNDGYILTAWHVIEDPNAKITVEYLGVSVETGYSEAYAIYMIPVAAKLIGYA
ncbi:MAG: hypothetical protein HZA25_01350, partial [Candidatus Niyogibacteria bacterium]|nr:hypothetical protein [Candidatus Niyogibacteria bacterium]